MSFLAAMLGVWVVVQPVANMHSGPSADTDVVSQAIYSIQVEIVATEERGGKRYHTICDLNMQNGCVTKCQDFVFSQS